MKLSNSITYVLKCFPSMPLIELLPRAMPSRNLTTQLAVQETVPIMPRCEKLHQSLIEIRSSPHYHHLHILSTSTSLSSFNSPLAATHVSHLWFGISGHRALNNVQAKASLTMICNLCNVDKRHGLARFGSCFGARLSSWGCARWVSQWIMIISHDALAVVKFYRQCESQSRKAKKPHAQINFYYFIVDACWKPLKK